jgi:2-dehydro-3-deoxygluconokinase
VGERGAVVDDGGGPTAVEPEQLETVVDEIGAGDAFAAGFAFGLLQSWDPTDCVAVGNFVAAAALRGTGDWETCPRVEDLKPFLARMGKSAPAPP